MVEVDPMSMVALFNGALTMNTLEGHDDLAVEMMLERLESLDKSYGYSARARVEESRGNLAAAAAYHYQSLELDPGRSSNRNNLAELLARLGLVDEALLVSPDSDDDIAFWMADWETAIRLANEDLEQEPDSIDAKMNLFTVLMWSGDADGAYPLAAQIWERFEKYPAQMGFLPVSMAWVAAKTEHTQQAQLYREAGARWLQNLIEAGLINVGRFANEALLAAIDGRDDDVIMAIANAIDNGASWQAFFQHPVFDHLGNDVRFQAQVNRMADLNNTNRAEILEMLCGPETILTSWQPAPATCEIYRQETAIASG
jgi:tetratricopeptide (TPR) repeat protein